MTGIVNSTGARSGIIGTITSAPVTGIDYEEGTWTPDIIGTTGSLGSLAYAGRLGDYIKIGKMVYFDFYANLTNKGSWTGYLRVTGLPYANTGFDKQTSCTIGRYMSNMTVPMACTIPTGQSYMEFKEGAYLATLSPYSDVIVTKSFSVTGVYHIA